jgi:hypothetical protein
MSVGASADDETSRYTTEHLGQQKFQKLCKSFLLCCPLLSPQIVGATVADPKTSNVSIQVPSVGCAVVNETKSKLKNKWKFTN